MQISLTEQDLETAVTVYIQSQLNTDAALTVVMPVEVPTEFSINQGTPAGEEAKTPRKRGPNKAKTVTKDPVETSTVVEPEEAPVPVAISAEELAGLTEEGDAPVEDAETEEVAAMMEGKKAPAKSLMFGQTASK